MRKILTIANKPYSGNFALPMGKYAVTGFGRVAKETVAVLKSLSCDVTVFARNPSQREDAIIKGCKAEPLTSLSQLSGDFAIIINTVPAHIIHEESIVNMKKECKIIELASAPFGLDFDLAQKHGIDVVKALGLPGKYTPKTAREIIGKNISQREE